MIFCVIPPPATAVCILAMALLFWFASPTAMAAASRGDYVVLLHGSGRTALSMKRLEWRLTRRGYRVINESYPSWNSPAEKVAADYLPTLLRRRILDPEAQVHFVTHSLGGIVVRKFLAEHEMPKLGRVVMMGPPNQGSEIVDHLRENVLARTMLGASRLALGTRETDLPKRLGPVAFNCGVIAGDRSPNPLLSRWLPVPNDGKVSVASARVAGMSDFVIVHHTHTWMMWRQPVLHQVESFLRTGVFDHATQ